MSNCKTTVTLTYQAYESIKGLHHNICSVFQVTES